MQATTFETRIGKKSRNPSELGEPIHKFRRIELVGSSAKFRRKQFTPGHAVFVFVLVLIVRPLVGIGARKLLFKNSGCFVGQKAIEVKMRNRLVFAVLFRQRGESRAPTVERKRLSRTTGRSYFITGGSCHSHLSSVLIVSTSW